MLRSPRKRDPSSIKVCRTRQPYGCDGPHVSMHAGSPGILSSNFKCRPNPSAAVRIATPSIGWQKPCSSSVNGRATQFPLTRRFLLKVSAFAQRNGRNPVVLPKGASPARPSPSFRPLPVNAAGRNFGGVACGNELEMGIHVTLKWEKQGFNRAPHRM
jgi:hypothetical protein